MATPRDKSKVKQKENGNGKKEEKPFFGSDEYKKAIAKRKKALEDAAKY